MNKSKSTFLFASPSFVSGCARVLDLYGFYDQYNCSHTEQEADGKAIWSDWSLVGQDMCVAIEHFRSYLHAADGAHEMHEQLSFFQ